MSTTRFFGRELNREDKTYLSGKKFDKASLRIRDHLVQHEVFPVAARAFRTAVGKIGSKRKDENIGCAINMSHYAAINARTSQQAIQNAHRELSHVLY